MSLQKSIETILDTPKVEGLVIFDLEGQIHFKKVPENTNLELLEKLPQRVLTMYAVVDDNLQNCSDFILKYEKKSLYIRKTMGKVNAEHGSDFVIAIIAEAGVNFISLKLVSNLAMKIIRLDQNDLG